ncbi:MAG: prolyl oligopeptidase family serine peptidase [Lentisphaerota bacterium]
MSASYKSYDSSVDPALNLHARFAPLTQPAPLLLWMHGWHGNIKSGHKDNVTPPDEETFFKVQPEMRGRGDSGGKPDANGWELQDAVDALAAARKHYPNAVADLAPRLHGGSGGGGNVLGILGKFPDLFSSAVCECGISDYALWYSHDTVGEFRDEMKDAGWIGGDPLTNPEAYLSRGGRTTAKNLLTPLLMLHGTADKRVPFEQAEAYMDALRNNGKSQLVRLQEFPGVGAPDHFSDMTEEMNKLRKKLIAEHHLRNSQAPRLPESGEFVVAGYLKTSRFEVSLESVDQVALLHYDLPRQNFAF